MAVVDVGVAVHTHVTTVDLARADVPAVLGVLTAATRERASGAAGLISSTWLSRRPGDDDAARLVHYGQWTDEEHCADGAGVLLPLDDVAHLLRSTVVHGYDVHAVVCAAEGLPLVLAARDGVTTYLITMDARDGEQDFLTSFNATDTRKIFAPRDGFVAAAILRGHDGSHILEVVQWASPADFGAAAARPEFAGHIATIAARAHGSDAGVYDVVATL